MVRLTESHSKMVGALEYKSGCCPLLKYVLVRNSLVFAYLEQKSVGYSMDKLKLTGNNQGLVFNS